MPSHDRRSAGRRRAWGRGPIILKFDSLERRDLMTAAGSALPDLVASSFVTSPTADWNDPITASGQITNQGRGAVTTPFNVGIYASHSRVVGPNSVLIGEVTIPGGLAPGQSVPFTTTARLPVAAVPGTGANGGVFVDAKVDPEGLITESNKRNNTGVGAGRDSSAVQIAPRQPSHLVSTAIGINPTSAQWGGSIVVTSQIRNQAYGDAPASRAQVVLTPVGATPGGPSDVTIGSIAVPAIPAWMMVNVETSIPLPATPPQALSSASQYTISVLPDGDYLTNSVHPHVATGGAGVDQATVNITVPPGTTPPALGPLSDLAAGAVTVSPGSLLWGHGFQVQTVLQNLGQADPGPFRVRFLLVAATGDVSQGLFLGDSTVNGLPAGNAQVLTRLLELPSRVPAGVTISSLQTGRIAVIVDPEHVLNETFANNNVATSGPITLKLLGTDGTSSVPNLPPPSQLLAVNAVTTAKATPAPAATTQTAGSKKLYRKPPPKHNSFLHNLSVFPKRLNTLIKKYI